MTLSYSPSPCRILNLNWPSLIPAGYAPLAYRAEDGIDLESTHVVLRALGAYDNGHETKDNNQPNPNGHDRYLEGAAYFLTRSNGSRARLALERAFHLELHQGR